MISKNDQEDIIRLLNIFIDGVDRSLAMTGKIEVLLDETFSDDEEIQSYVTDFASYRPEGGAYLFSIEEMVVKCKAILMIITGKQASH